MFKSKIGITKAPVKTRCPPDTLIYDELQHGCTILARHSLHLQVSYV